jgi:hypothetical protein
LPDNFTRKIILWRRKILRQGYSSGLLFAGKFFAEKFFAEVIFGRAKDFPLEVFFAELFFAGEKTWSKNMAKNFSSEESSREEFSTSRDFFSSEELSGEEYS